MPKALSQTIRQTIVAHMQAQGLSSRRLAGMTGGAVSETMLQRFVRGSHDITTAKADALLLALGESHPRAESKRAAK